MYGEDQSDPNDPMKPKYPGQRTPSQQWSQQPQKPNTTFGTSKGDVLYGTLNDRASQGLAVNPSDPAIRQQSDVYAANQQRGMRDYLSNQAEQRGPLVNLQGERRMASERAAQATSGFEAELMSREVAARRDEISQALSQMGGMISQEQQMGLQRELASLNAQLQREQMAQSGMLAGRGLDLQAGGLDLQRTGQAQSNDQFLRELALREFDTNNRWDYNWLMGGL
jgi:hypothetical protein